jgi:lipopolysaccharide/colanic/teichoic acid biosynthesis glycosyltransferase
MYRHLFKTALDIVLSFGGLLILSPVFILLIILLWFTNSRKVLFIQQRPGKNERIFKLIKFKTMNDRTDAKGELLPNAERLTAVGKFLRNTSLDELPQLLNVLKGDMSLVGPRPLLIAYLPLYNTRQNLRHRVRPGITGWAQVNGRNAISWQQKFEYDVWYVEHLSFLLDLKIIWMTVKKLFRPEGVNASDAVGMERFKGNS